VVCSPSLAVAKNAIENIGAKNHNSIKAKSFCLLQTLKWVMRRLRIFSPLVFAAARRAVAAAAAVVQKESVCLYWLRRIVLHAQKQGGQKHLMCCRFLYSLGDMAKSRSQKDKKIKSNQKLKNKKPQNREGKELKVGGGG
jgi:hypothetical protein